MKKRLLFSAYGIVVALVVSVGVVCTYNGMHMGLYEQCVTANDELRLDLQQRDFLVKYYGQFTNVGYSAVSSRSSVDEINHILRNINEFHAAGECRKDMNVFELVDNVNRISNDIEKVREQSFNLRSAAMKVDRDIQLKAEDDARHKLIDLKQRAQKLYDDNASLSDSDAMCALDAAINNSDDSSAKSVAQSINNLYDAIARVNYELP